MALINIVRDYERIARFRLGRFEGMKGPGLVVSIPILHQIRRLDTRINVLDIPRQTNITKDNASIEIDFLVYLRVDINRAERAVLEVDDYRSAVVGLATTTLRAVIGDIDLDDVLSQRDKINEDIRARLDSETERWGIKVTNVEIREVDPPPEIKEAMNRQMSAERVRRAAVLEADGQREAQIRRAEGEKRAAVLAAEGRREALILTAEGERQSTLLRAEGYALGLGEVHKVAQGVEGNTMTLQYVEALKEIANGQSTKIVLPLELTKLLDSLKLPGAPAGKGSGGGSAGGGAKK